MLGRGRHTQNCIQLDSKPSLLKSLFPIALSREETVFWHPHRVTPLHFIEGGSLQKPCAGCTQKWFILLYAPVQLCVCLLGPRHFWSKVCMFFCFPIVLSREETVFWHPHRVTPLHFIEGGFCRSQILFVCGGRAQKLFILLYAPVQFCVCLLEPRHFWSKVCMIFAFPLRSPGKRQFSGTLRGSHPFIL